MDKIIPIAILVLFIILTASWLFSRYRMCPPDKILIVFGKVGTGQPAKCYHGGSTFVLPVISAARLRISSRERPSRRAAAFCMISGRVEMPTMKEEGTSTRMF